MEKYILPSADEAVKKMADYFIEKANYYIAHTGKFIVALSGGSSPKKLYELLATEKYNSLTNWSKIYFFFGDERYVPQTSADSNYLMAKNTLFSPLEISSANIFAVDTGFEPEKVAENYQEVINTFFGESQPVFNLVLLGLGDNSHTASLFPFTPVLADVSPSVKAVWLEEQKVFRLTLNAPLINLADNIAYLVYGKGKAEAVKHIIEDDTNYDLYPAQLIQPIQGSLAWFMDAEAAASLQKD